MNFVPLMAIAAEENQGTGLQWWFWLILIIVIVAIFLWLWLSGKKPVSDVVPDKKEVQKIPEPVSEKVVTPTKIEDFEIIEGIGPKINKVLHAAGLNTFADLAAADADTLKKILLDQKLRLADPTSWPAQAALVRDGKLDELKAMQEKLNAGRA